MSGRSCLDALEMDGSRPVGSAWRSPPAIRFFATRSAGDRAQFTPVVSRHGCCCASGLEEMHLALLDAEHAKRDAEQARLDAEARTREAEAETARLRAELAALKR
jgi:hypothetical protein